jgi:hypothetical protein
MANADFTTTIIVDQSAIEVYDAINNVGAWWQGEITGDSTKVDGVFDYRMKDIHYSKQQVVELIPGEKVVWLVTDSNLSFTSTKTEWTGTKITFEIASVSDKTQVRFTHEGLVPAFECYGGCSNGWTKLIQESLCSYITTGKSVNVFG